MLDELINSIDPRKHEALILALKDLNCVIGLDDVKEQVCRQVKYALYNLNRKLPISGMHHTLITGEPGLGKSMLATKLGNIWLSLGILDYSKEPIVETSVNVKEFTNFLMWIHRLSQEPSRTRVSSRGRTYTVGGRQIAQNNATRRKHLRSSVSAYINKLYQGPIAETYHTSAWRAVKDIVNNKLNPNQEETIYNQSIDPFFLEYTGQLSGVIPAPAPLMTKPICKIFRKADLVGKYVGHTAPKTEKALKSCLGGVFILDEAYSLLNSSSCKFGIECLNTINQFMSEHPNEIIVIFCGYKDMIQNLYDAQRGLARRFNWVYDLTKYTSEELVKIYKSKLFDSNNFKLDSTVTDTGLVQLFDRKKDMFKFQAGDIENLATLTQIEIATSHWNSSLNSPSFNSISFKNIEDALARFEKGKHSDKKVDEPLHMMYL